ncbi:MAG: hypothetical protein LBG27_08805 [Spirochaetaceae bacterium]|jgi:hypothetical protein|nr:hypothetical protein [Spirochaetaceae bacterium]
MNKQRKLQQNVWYKVETEINIGEPLFRLPWTKVLLHRVLREIRKRYPFGMRGLRLEGARLTFCIKPEDGLKLPKIMQWLKQTFSARFNARTGRTGHVWGERYESEILNGEPPEDAEMADWAAIDKSANTPIAGAAAYILSWDSLRSPGMTITARFSARNAADPASPPG